MKLALHDRDTNEDSLVIETTVDDPDGDVATVELNGELVYLGAAEAELLADALHYIAYGGEEPDSE